MFRALAPILRDNGWSAVIPLRSGEKRPVVHGWEAFNRHGPSDTLIDRWVQAHPDAGIGLAYGPDGVLGCDLDFMDPEKAAFARHIADETLGHTPMARIGKPPKVLALYRAYPDLRAPGKNFGGFEIFSRSGQTVLYGIHPGTGGPYHWPDASPETLSPRDLPVVTQEMLEAFIAQMEPLREDRASHNGAPATNTGAAGTWLRLFATLRTPEEMIEAACVGIRGVGVGARHCTMQAATMALVMRGVEPEEFVNRIEAAYAETLNPAEARARRNAVRNAARWANAKAWGGNVNVAPVQLRVRW